MSDPTPKLASTSAAPLPCLTAGLPGIGGRIKVRAEDFVVSEVPAYEPAGSGTHVYFGIEKAGIDTRTAVVRIAQALGRPARDFGYAGLKDRHAVSRQTISIEHVEPERVRQLDVPGLRVLWVNRHGNKLRLGHLRGNRFEIKIRDVRSDAVRRRGPDSLTSTPRPDALTGTLQTAQAIMDVLARRGLPNYFGPQRFGVRGTGHQLGLALLRGDDREFLDLLLGRPDRAIDYGAMFHARRLYDEGKLEDARQAWPGNHRDERAALHALIHGRNPRRARHAVDKHLRRFFVSAFQSFLFNDVLVARLESIDKLLPGDLAFKHDNGAVFHVEDPAVEQPRADRLEISPSGPLYGYRMTWPAAEPERIERQVIERYGINLEWFSQGEHHVRGERRPLRISLAQPTVAAGDDDAGPFIQVAFGLPSGAYATVVLAELMKTESAEAEQPAEEADHDDTSD